MIDAIRETTSKYIKYMGFMEDDDAVEAIESLPSAQPERNTGEWIKVKRCEEDTQPNLKCPFCGNIVGWFDLAKYCAGCGAKLEGGAG